EILRDSNSRQFEGDRFQHLALRSTTRKDFDDNRGEAADVMKESADGFDEFAKTARTPQLRQEAAAQAALMRKVQSTRERALALWQPGQPLSAEGEKLIASVEDMIEQADESNDAMVENEEKVTAQIAHDSAATAAHGKHMVIIVLALAALLALLVSWAV